MRIDETSTDAPLTSPEEPPATSYAVVFLRSPVCFSVTWGPLVSRRAEGGSQRGLCRILGRASARVVGRRSFRPAQ